jgi:hypothetical protein
MIQEQGLGNRDQGVRTIDGERMDGCARERRKQVLRAAQEDAPMLFRAEFADYDYGGGGADAVGAGFEHGLDVG